MMSKMLMMTRRGHSQQQALQVVVSYHMGVLGTKLKPSVRAECTLNHPELSPGPSLFCTSTDCPSFQQQPRIT